MVMIVDIVDINSYFNFLYSSNYDVNFFLTRQKITKRNNLEHRPRHSLILYKRSTLFDFLLLKYKKNGSLPNQINKYFLNCNVFYFIKLHITCNFDIFDKLLFISVFSTCESFTISILNH